MERKRTLDLSLSPLGAEPKRRRTDQYQSRGSMSSLPTDIKSEVARFLGAKEQARFSEIAPGYRSVHGSSDLAILEDAIRNSNISSPPSPYVMDMLNNPMYRNWVKPVATALVTNPPPGDVWEDITGIEAILGHAKLTDAVKSDEKLAQVVLLNVLAGDFWMDASEEMFQFLASLLTPQTLKALADASPHETGFIEGLVNRLSREQLESQELVAAVFKQFTRGHGPYRTIDPEVARRLVLAVLAVKPEVWHSVVRNHIQELFPWFDERRMRQHEQERLAKLIVDTIPTNDPSLAVPVLETLFEMESKVELNGNELFRALATVAAPLVRLLRTN